MESGIRPTNFEQPVDILLFTEEMMTGGYMKKYHRTVSRLTALARAGLRVVVEMHQDVFGEAFGDNPR